MKLITITADACHAVSWIFRYASMHSCYCVPVELLIKSNAWDPWLIAEDTLMLKRTYLATGGNLKHSILRTLVYNAPAITFNDYIWQRYRVYVSIWHALGYWFINLWKFVPWYNCILPAFTGLVHIGFSLLLVLKLYYILHFIYTF
eukprot:UN24373